MLAKQGQLDQKRHIWLHARQHWMAVKWCNAHENNVTSFNYLNRGPETENNVGDRRVIRSPFGDTLLFVFSLSTVTTIRRVDV